MDDSNVVRLHTGLESKQARSFVFSRSVMHSNQAIRKIQCIKEEDGSSAFGDSRSSDGDESEQNEGAHCIEGAPSGDN